jgi:cell division protein FtsA
LNILQRKSFYRNLNKCFDNAGIAIAEMYLAPLVLADSVLTEAERRSGCVLVDLGADTTTVSVYYKNILRHLAVIPLGGNNVTKDISTVQMEEHEAERIKLKYGSAYTDNSDIDDTLRLPIDQERTVESRKLIDIVEGRMDEIIENVWFQVPNEYVDKLLSGIILTGGGSNMKNIERAFRNHTHLPKIRVAKFVQQTINSNNPEITAKDGTMNTILGLLEKGDINCAGSEITNDLFETDRPLNTAKNRTPDRTGVITQRTTTDEAKKKLQEKDNNAPQNEPEKKDDKEKKERKENSIANKTLKNLKTFFKKMVEEEE